MKICIILPNLLPGGAEKVHLNLISEWLKERNSVHLIVLNLRDQYGELLPLLPEDCKLTNLNVKKISHSIIPISKILFKNKFEVLLASMWPLTIVTIISKLISFNKAKLFLSEHTHLSESRESELRVPKWLLSSTIRIFYRFANGVITVSNSVKKDLEQLGNSSKDTTVIFNPCISLEMKMQKEEIELCKNKLWNNDYKYKILAVGSLKPVKNFSMLINAISNLPSHLKNSCQLIILGEGEQRSCLTSLINKNKMQNQIFMPGFKIDPMPWFFSADLFVMSSNWEGFGNVIVEALAADLKIISTDCYGPKEILKDQQNSILVPISDTEAMTEAIKHSLEGKERLKSNQKLLEIYTKEYASQKYIDFFNHK